MNCMLQKGILIFFGILIFCILIVRVAVVRPLSPLFGIRPLSPLFGILIVGLR